jgi:hypothetical protein
MNSFIMDNHAAFNRYQVMDGMRLNESGADISAYVTFVKLRKVINALTDDELKRLFGKTKMLSKLALLRLKEKLLKKLDSLSKPNLTTALNIYLREGEGELCARYMLACKKSGEKH